MALITKTICSRSLLQYAQLLNHAATRQSHWFPDYKPGPFPKTEEEKKQAAEKYNLLPEEYETYPDDGFGLGDYPKLPFESVDSKDHNTIYDFPALRRNYMEAVPSEQIILLPGLISTTPRKRSRLREFCYFMCYVIVGSSVCYFFTLFKLNSPVLKMQVPTHGVTHYTFELEDKK